MTPIESPDPIPGHSPAITVVLPVFKAADKIPASLDSVLVRQAPVADVLVVDGASPDATADVVRDWQGRFPGRIHFLSEPDRGVYDAMNKGIAWAAGRYLYFLGAGDVLRDRVLDEVVVHLPNHDRGFVYGDVMWGERFYGGPFSKARLRFHNVCHQAIFYGREVFDLVGDYNLKYKTQADQELNYRCFGNRRVLKKHLPLLIADYEGGGISEQNVDLAFVEDRPALIRRHLGLGLSIRTRLGELSKRVRRGMGLLP